jgi:hypothetical protein
MYLQNKYTDYYYSIVNQAKARAIDGYIEQHHIIPKSLGGSDDASNLVELTPREHFICHWLLTKMLPKSSEQKKLYHAFSAFNMSSSNQQRKISSRQYQILSKASKVAMKGNTHNKGKTRTAEANEKQRQTMLAKYKEQTYKNAGKTYEELYSDAAARKAKLRGPRGCRKNPPGPQSVVTCPRCGKKGGISNMKRYHFNNCSFQKVESASHS